MGKPDGTQEEQAHKLARREPRVHATAEQTAPDALMLSSQDDVTSTKSLRIIPVDHILKEVPKVVVGVLKVDPSMVVDAIVEIGAASTSPLHYKKCLDDW